MKYAVIKTGGKQYRVAEGTILKLDKLEAEPKSRIEFQDVLLVVDNGQVLIGQPLVPKAKVTAEVLEQVLGEKIRVAKFRAKTRYRRVRGFRPRLTRVKIEKILTVAEEKTKTKGITKTASRKTSKKPPAKV